MYICSPENHYIHNNTSNCNPLPRSSVSFSPWTPWSLMHSLIWSIPLHAPISLCHHHYRSHNNDFLSHLNSKTAAAGSHHIDFLFILPSLWHPEPGYLHSRAPCSPCSGSNTHASPSSYADAHLTSLWATKVFPVLVQVPILLISIMFLLCDDMALRLSRSGKTKGSRRGKEELPLDLYDFIFLWLSL